MFYAKLHQHGRDTLLAVCDEALLGKRLPHADFEFNVTKRFYGGDKIDETELETLLDAATVANLIGEDTIALAKKRGLLDDSGVLMVGKVPHAQIVRML